MPTPAQMMLMASKAPAGGGLTPDKFWYDASDTGSITEASGLVSGWADLAASGLDLSEATNKPTTNATTKNSLNVIDFDSTDRLAAATAADWKFTTDGTPWTFYSVAKYNSGTMEICSTGPLTAAVQWSFLGDAGKAYTVAHNGSTFVMEKGTAASTWTASTWAIVCLRNDIGNGTADLRLTVNINGGANTTGNTRTATPSASNPAAPLTVGRAPSGTAYQLTGSIGELQGFDGLHDDTTVADNIAALNTKWAVY